MARVVPSTDIMLRGLYYDAGQTIEMADDDPLLAELIEAGSIRIEGASASFDAVVVTDNDGDEDEDDDEESEEAEDAGEDEPEKPATSKRPDPPAMPKLPRVKKTRSRR